MKLSVGERLVLLSVLPQEGDFTTLKIIRNLKDDLSFTEEEHKLYQFQFEGEQVIWENNGDKEINFGEKATDIIVNAFKKLDQQKKLRMEHIELYEKFVGE